LLEVTVERSEARLADLAFVRPTNLGRKPRVQPLGRQFLSTPPEAPGDVGAIHA